MEKINKKIREKRKIIFILRINLKRRTNLYFRMLMLGSIENASETLTQTFPILRGEERERGRRTAKTSSLFTSKLKNPLSSAAVRRETSTRSLTKSKRIRTQDFLPLTLPQVFLISMTGPNSFKMMRKRKAWQQNLSCHTHLYEACTFHEDRGVTNVIFKIFQKKFF